MSCCEQMTGPRRVTARCDDLGFVTLASHWCARRHFPLRGALTPGNCSKDSGRACQMRDFACKLSLPVNRDRLRLIAGIVEDLNFPGLDDEKPGHAIADCNQRFTIVVTAQAWLRRPLCCSTMARTSACRIAQTWPPSSGARDSTPRSSTLAARRRITSTMRQCATPLNSISSVNDRKFTPRPLKSSTIAMRLRKLRASILGARL